MIIQTKNISLILKNYFDDFLGQKTFANLSTSSVVQKRQSEKL